MNANAVQEQLIHWTVQHSGHDAMRRYLGMSRISECPRVLYHEVIDGPTRPNPAQFLTFYAGYLWERDLKLRLESIGHYMLGSEREIVADFDARFRGHTDGALRDGTLVEIKSTVQAALDHIIETKRASRRHFEQVQMYLKHGGFDRALIVYAARDTGNLHIVELRAVPAVQANLDAKAKRILDAVDKGVIPPCECRRCSE